MVLVLGICYLELSPQAMVEHFGVGRRRTPKGFARRGGQAEQGLRRLDEKVIIALDSGMDWVLR